MAELSKQVVNLLNNSDVISSSLVAHKELLVDGLVDAFGELEPRERLSRREVEKFIHAAGALLEHTAEQLRNSEQSYALEKGEDVEKRAERNQSSDLLRVAMQTVRDRMLGYGGEPLLKRYRIPLAMPRTTQKMQETAETIVKALNDKPETFTDLFGLQLSTQQMAKSLGGQLEKVKNARKDLGVEIRETQAAMLTRDQHAEQFHKTYGGVGNIAAGCFELLGEVGHAARLRPTVRRRRGEDKAPKSEEQTPTTPAAEKE